MIRRLNKNDRINFLDYFSQIENNLFIDCSFKGLEKEFNKIIKNNIICLVDCDNGKIKGIIFVIKINDEHYINTVYNNPKILDKLLQVLFWNFNNDIFIKVNDYKVVNVLKKNFFRFKGREGNNYIYLRNEYKKVKKDVKL